MVAFNAGRGLIFRSLAFNHIRIQGALGQKSGVLQFGGGFLKNINELSADGFALFLRIRNPLQAGQETLGGVHIKQVQSQAAPVGFRHLLGLALPQQAVIDKNASQPLANSPVQQQGGH